MLGVKRLGRIRLAEKNSKLLWLNPACWLLNLFRSLYLVSEEFVISRQIERYVQSFESSCVREGVFTMEDTFCLMCDGLLVRYAYEDDPELFEYHCAKCNQFWKPGEEGIEFFAPPPKKCPGCLAKFGLSLKPLDRLFPLRKLAQSYACTICPATFIEERNNLVLSRSQPSGGLIPPSGGLNPPSGGLINP